MRKKQEGSPFSFSKFHAPRFQKEEQERAIAKENAKKLALKVHQSGVVQFWEAFDGCPKAWLELLEKSSVSQAQYYFKILRERANGHDE